MKKYFGFNNLPYPHLLLDELNDLLLLPGHTLNSYQALGKLKQFLFYFWRDQIQCVHDYLSSLTDVTAI